MSLEDQEHRGLARTLKDLQISDNNSESRIESDMDIMMETEIEPVEDVEQLVSEEVTELESLGVCESLKKTWKETLTNIMFSSNVIISPKFDYKLQLKTLHLNHFGQVHLMPTQEVRNLLLNDTKPMETWTRQGYDISLR